MVYLSRIRILEGPTSASSKHSHDLTPISGLLGASGVDVGWCWVLCAGSWVPFLRFPLWEFHVKAICFHVRVSFDKTSQLLRRFEMRSSSSTSSSCCSSSDSTPAPDLAPASDSAPAPDSAGHTVANLLLPLAVLVLVHSVPSTTFI